MDAIDHARNGNLEFFKTAPLDVLQNARDDNDENILSIAIKREYLECCEVICTRCPSLLYHQDSLHGYTPLHHAAYAENVDIAKLIITACVKADLKYPKHIESQGGDRAHPQKSLTLRDKFGENAIHKSMYKNQLEALKLLIEEDPDNEMLMTHNNNRETPLIMAINNPDISLREDMLKLILEKQPSQAMLCRHNNGRTVLHFAVSKGFITLVGDIVQWWPDSSEVVDNEGRNFLHLAAELNDVNMVKHILEKNVISASRALNRQDNLGNAPLDWVVQKQNFVMMNLLMEAIPDFLKEIDSEVLLNSKDENGDTNTILIEAVQKNHLRLCKEIYKRCPLLIYHKGENGCTALHHAAVRGEPKMLEFLIKPYNEDDAEDIESGGSETHFWKMLRMVDVQNDTALHKAVLCHKLEAVRLLVEADLHFEYSTNNSGKTPLMIAIREAESNENRHDTGEIRKLLYMKQPNQTKVRTGENEWTLLHHAAKNGDVSIIKDIIMFCPSCLELVDNEGKNFLHIAAKEERVQVVTHFLGARDIPISVLNAQDNDGNTPLHIAARTRNDPMTLSFLYDLRVMKTTVNKVGQHVLDAINFPYDKRNAGVFGFAGKVDESDVKDQRDFDLVVNALIATVSFTAGITVPGGYYSEQPNQGTAVLSKNPSFAAFIISNTLALIFSLYAVFSHYCARRLSDYKDIKFLLNVATLCTLAAIYCMMAAFIAGSYAVLDKSKWVDIVVCVLCSCFFLFALYPIYKLIMEHKRRSTAASQHNRST